MRIIRPVLITILFFLLPVLFLWKLTVAGRILVGGDPLNFFYPYHDGVAAALATGRLPQWNPYLFGGVPFLADSQAQVFYPMAWLFWGLDAPTALTWSVILHLGIAGVGVYVWARRGLGMGVLGSWVAGVVFALGGYLGAQIEHVNQVAAAAWIPWMLAGYQMMQEKADAPSHTPRTQWWGLAMGSIALGMSLLAGHAQTTFMGLVLLGLWAIRTLFREYPRSTWRTAWMPFVTVAVIVGLGALIAAVQLVPTQLLSGLSTRAGGLEFREAAAFSFDPRIALRAFFPTFGQDGELLSEYVAWVGFSGLALAGIGVWRGNGTAREFGLLSSVTGLFLALGAYNPLFWLLWRIVPGFDLFRVPARWLLLWALGVAVLAGLGIETGIRNTERSKKRTQDTGRRKGWWMGIGVIVILGFIALVVFGDFPDLGVLPWWAGIVASTAIFMGGWWFVEHRSTFRNLQLAFPFLMAGFLLVELWLASWGLGYQGATAAEAYTGMRTTVAHLLTMQEEEGSGRVLSQSGLTWDPGDLARLQGRYAEQLDDEAIYDLVVATKLKEVLAPNQPMRWGISSADGYGGGLLPSARWVEFQRVLPLAKVVPDGRLREQLTAVPRPALLDVMGVEWMVADKVMDWWSEGIYHDLGAARTIHTEEQVIWTPPAGQTFMQMDTLSFVVHGALPPNAGTVVLGTQNFDLNQATERGIRTTPLGEERHYTLALGEIIGNVEQIEIYGGSNTWVLGGLTIWNSRLRGFEALAAEPSLSTTLSGDVKVYERQDFVGRAWFAPTARFVPDSEQVTTALVESDHDSRSVVMVEDERNVFEIFGDESTVEWVREDAERLEMRVDSAEGGWLVVADAPFPGWTVTIDGVETEWYPANVINRVVPVPAGSHTVIWEYQTPGLAWGMGGTILGGIGLIGILLWGATRPRAS